MFKHIKKDIVSKQDVIRELKFFKTEIPEIVALDTETTGLNIVVDTPFLIQFGWLNGSVIYTYTIDLEAHPKLAYDATWALLELVRKYSKLIGHNIKYDLHMLDNIGLNYDGPVSDTQIYIRLAHSSLTPENGGPPMSLKDYATRYIDRTAKDHERKLKEERTLLAKKYNADLLSNLRFFPNPPEGYKSWTKGALEELFKDVLATVDTLPTQEMRDVYQTWFDKLPEAISRRMRTMFVTSEDIPYNMLTRETVVEYGHYDIYYTLCIYYKTKQVVAVRQQDTAKDIEESCIHPLKKMERVGFKIDKEYVHESKDRMQSYILRRRADLYQLIGQPIGIGQHKKIKELILEKFGVELLETNDTYLGVKIPELVRDGHSDVVDILNTIKELRTLDKWYSTYLLRFINELKLCDRIYTQINQVGTVSGRVTSDFQQFPKFGIQTIEGGDLFNPRNMVIKSDNAIGLYYLDYSQIELRLQALYTILVGEPDLNLCRAYMPYKCWVLQDDKRVMFNYHDSEHLANAYIWEWFREEDDEPWHKTDVHSASTALAFPELDVDSEEFKKMRGKVGKRLNFAKNYGAQYSKISTMFPQFNFSVEKLHQIDDAYYAAFPGVKAYHSYCYQLARTSAYATNLFGVRYYGLTGHKLINCLIQGSGAYFLKLKIVEVQDYIAKNNLETKFQMNIHDELSFELAEGEEEHIFEIQKIMQKYSDSLVPIVADIEVSNTSWANKEEASTLEDVKGILYKTGRE